MAEQEKISCPICKLTESVVGESTDFGRDSSYCCPRCGRFKITGTAKAMAENQQTIPKLSAWIRDRHEKEADIPEINSESLKRIVNSLPDYSPSEKQLILLKNLERKSNYPGYPVDLKPIIDFPLAWSTTPDDFCYYLASLHDRGLLQFNKAALFLSARSFGLSLKLPVTISPDGWDYLEKRASQIEEKTQVFVAMSFSREMKAAWEKALKDAITEAGYKAYRIDAEPHIDRIDAKIITEIKNSRFLVADVTEQKHGVYFEAGYALGLGFPVIWSVRKDHLSKVHFDTRQYNHIVWESEEQLKEQLYNFICAIIGKGKGSSSELK